MSTNQSTGRLARLLAFLVEHPDVSYENVVVSNNRVSFTVYFDTSQSEALRTAIQPSGSAWSIGPDSLRGQKIEFRTDDTPLGPVTVWFYRHHDTEAVAA